MIEDEFENDLGEIDSIIDSNDEKFNYNELNNNPIEEPDMDLWEEVEFGNFDIRNIIPEFKAECKLENIKNYTPLDIFTEYFTRELVESIAIETNKYFEQTKKKKTVLKKNSRMNEWVPVNSDDIYSFLGIILLMGIQRRLNVLDHFSQDVYLRSKVADIISRNKYQILMRFLHLHDNEIQTKSSDKISYFSNYLTYQWRRVFKPGQKLVIDETMAHFEGKSEMVQYMPLKPVRFGIKCWTFADSSLGYMLDMEIYEGKKAEIKVNDVVLNFLKEYKNKNHIIYMDSYFTNPSLCNKILDYGLNTIGVCKDNRKGLLKNFNEINVQDHETRFFKKNDLMILKYKDKRHIHMISTIKNSELLTIEYFNKENRLIKDKYKPMVLFDYSYSMKGVDRNNQLSSYYCYKNKFSKWWISVFIKLLDISVVNSYIILNNFGGFFESHKEFRLQLIKSLVKNSKFKKIKGPEIISILEYFKPYEDRKLRNCKLCTKNKKRTQTYLFCNLCYNKNNVFNWTCKNCQAEHIRFHLKI